MIWTLDKERHILFFNKRSEEITGFRLEDWQGKSFIPQIEKEDLPDMAEVFRKTLNGQNQHYEVSVKKKNGSIMTLSVNTAPMYSKGKVVGTVNFGSDITERKKAGDALLETKKNMEEAQRLAHIGSWQWNVATDTVKWSDELYKISGLDPNSSAPGYKELSLYYTLDSWKQLDAVVAKALQMGESYELDLDMFRPDGTLYYILPPGGKWIMMPAVRLQDYMVPFRTSPSASV